MRSAAVVAVLATTALVSSCTDQSSSPSAGPVSVAPSASRSASPQTLVSVSPLATRPPAQRCRRNQLRAQFEEGGNGTGQNFGSVLIRNVGAIRCTVTGRIGFDAYYSSGARDHKTIVQQGRHPRSYMLPPKIAPLVNQRNPHGYLEAVLAGSDRDDPHQPNGVCLHRDERAPQTLVVRIGSLIFRVSNNGPRSSYRQPDSPRPGAVYGCHGLIVFNTVIPPAES